MGKGSVLVVGAGISGIQSALDLADAGFRVYLVDKRPSIGGVMSQLDKTFPTNDCSMCILAPKMSDAFTHPGIVTITYTELESLEGAPGELKATLRHKARYVDPERCTGCGDCWEKCPKKVGNEFDEGLAERKAVYLPHPQAVPRVATIDKEHCIFLKTGKCGICAKVCTRKAIDHSMKDVLEVVEVGAVILSTGYDVWDPTPLREYGYGELANVHTSIEFERVLSASGPFGGHIKRRSDVRKVRRIAFLQCVGSRTGKRDGVGLPYCSSVCCMYSIKEAVIAKEHEPDVEPHIFFMDVRSFGKEFEYYYRRAKEIGVVFNRGRVAQVDEASDGSRDLLVRYLDEDDNRPKVERYDMVVLSCGLAPSKDLKELAGRLGVGLDVHGFVRTGDGDPVATSRPGVFVSGCAEAPKDIPETVAQASGAAARAASLLSEGRGSEVSEREYPPEKDVVGKEPRIGVIVCHCGINIGGVVDVPSVAEYARTLPNVVHAEDAIYSCSQETLTRIRDLVKEKDLNRIVVASCSPRTHEPLFRSNMREAGLNPYLFEMANIRDQCSWVHKDIPERATEKSRDLVRMAVAKARLLEPLQKGTVEVNRDVLVLGGGPVGMTSALELGRQGFKVHLVEKENELGGNLRNLRFNTGTGMDPKRKLASLKKSVMEDGNITVHLGSRARDVAGFVGNFRTTIETPDGERGIDHGAIIVAIGEKEYRPVEHLCGKDDRVMTHLDLEGMMDAGELPLISTAVIINCVGSRSTQRGERGHCSRICCGQGIQSAMRLKQRNPDARVFVLYRDIRTYGALEEEYRKAREMGVVFIRYTEDGKPETSKEGDDIVIKVRDLILDVELVLRPDIVVLGPAILPPDDAEDVARMLKVPLSRDGFFLEAHMKLRPVDFATEGIFLAGGAHGPKNMEESITQALAAAGRAASLLSRDRLETEAMISEIDLERCDGCALCVEPCPYQAITLTEEKDENGHVHKHIDVNVSLCKGCGVCMATCPKEAIVIRGFTARQIKAQIDAALECRDGGGVAE